MKNKLLVDREKIKLIENIIAIFIILFVIKSSIENFIDFQNQQEIVMSTSNIPILIIGAISCIFVGIANNIKLVIVFAAFKLASRSSHKKILDETDFDKNKNFYRDIIKNYSVSELNYIDDFQLEKKQSYTAKLLELEKKKIIKIENGKILKLKDPNNVIDTKFVNSIKNNKITMPLSEYEYLIENEALEHGLIKKASIFEKYKDKKMIIIMTIVFTLILLYLLFAAYVQGAGNIEETLIVAFIWLIIVIWFVFNFIIFFSISYFIKNALLNKYRRTDKGKEINLQLDGLKLFMKEFSNIDNKESKHLILWEEYLIYSVMFNINKKIQEEYSKYFD